MRIHFERTGGFAGMRLSTVVDTNQIPAEEAHALTEQLSAAGFFDLPELLNSTGHAADQFCYRITVEEGSRRHTVETSELAAPEPLRVLLRRLTSLARPRR